MRQKSLPQRVATWVLVAVIAATLLRTWDRLNSPPPPAEPRSIERPELVKWEMPGCYALRVDPWEWASPPADGAEVPSFLDLPARIRLLPDSTDRWMRSRVTYRAVPMKGDHDPRLKDYMRWVVRADTLWLVWSDRRAGGGLALRSVGDSLLGRVRVFDRRLNIDGSAGAAAWKLDCLTLERLRKRATPHR